MGIFKKKVKHIDLDKGKKIFFEYNGSTFGLSRDGLDVEYQNCNVPREIEKEWLEDIKNSLNNAIKKASGPKKITPLRKLIHIEDYEKGANLLLTMIKEENWDTFSRLILCEDLKRHQKYINHANLKKSIDEVIVLNINKLLQEPITVNDYYKKLSYMKDYDFSNENIKLRISNLLK